MASFRRIGACRIGAALLLWIAVKLLVPEDEGEGDINASDNLMSAIKTILIADLVMSLDNVIGVAAAAKGDLTLLILGLAISIPLVIFQGSESPSPQDQQVAWAAALVLLAGVLIASSAGRVLSLRSRRRIEQTR